jgi:hypothetical protein
MNTTARNMLGSGFPIAAFSDHRDAVPAVSNAAGFGVPGGIGCTSDPLAVEFAWIGKAAGNRR